MSLEYLIFALPYLLQVFLLLLPLLGVHPSTTARARPDPVLEPLIQGGYRVLISEPFCLEVEPQVDALQEVVQDGQPVGLAVICGYGEAGPVQGLKVGKLLRHVLDDLVSVVRGDHLHAVGRLSLSELVSQHPVVCAHTLKSLPGFGQALFGLL